MTKGPMQTEMEALLAAAFPDSTITLTNDSAAHHGHSGDDGSGESHFSLTITSPAFTGVTRLERQRMVNRALGDMPGERVHALAIKARTPEEVSPKD